MLMDLSALGHNRHQGATNRNQLRAAKSRSEGVRCGQYGHSYAHHNTDSSLRAGTASRSEPTVQAANDAAALRCHPRRHVSPPAEAAHEKQDGADGNALEFNMTTTVDANSNPAAERNTDTMAEGGPILDNGASYRSIGYSDLCMISASIGMNLSG